MLNGNCQEDVIASISKATYRSQISDQIHSNIQINKARIIKEKHVWKQYATLEESPLQRNFIHLADRYHLPTTSLKILRLEKQQKLQYLARTVPKNNFLKLC